MSDYPEHEKLAAVVDRSQAIGEFVEWLLGKGIHLAEYQFEVDCEWKSARMMGGQPARRCVDGRCIDFKEDDIGPCPVCEGEGKVQVENPRMYPIMGGVVPLLSEFFGIDQDKLEAEKRSMLDALRATSR